MSDRVTHLEPVNESSQDPRPGRAERRRLTREEARLRRKVSPRLLAAVRGDMRRLAATAPADDGEELG